MKKIIMIAIVLIASNGLKAQNQIEGKVLELSQDGKTTPIFGANVYWEDTNIGTTTDINGVYFINEATSFPATLSVSYVGYSFDSQEIIDDKYIFYLKSTIELDAVQIEGKVNTTKLSTVNSINMQTICTGELEKAACCNLSESFTTNATVDVIFTDAVSGAKQIQMLGLDGVYTQITQENMPLIRGMSSSYGLSYVPGTWIESIQIIKGTGSVVNGFESFAGQINVEYYKPESAPKIFWNGFVSSEGRIENNLLLAKKQGNWKSNLFTHISYFDKEMDENGDNFLDMPKVNQVNVLNRWEYKDNNYHIGFTARGLVEDRLGGTIENALNPYAVNIHNDLLEFTSKTGAILPNSPGKSAGLQTSFRRHNQTAIFGENNYKGLQESAYLNLIRQTYLGTTDHKLKYGISYYADRFTESFEGNIDKEFSDKIRMDLMSGLFSEYNYNWGESFNLTAGLRADYYNNTEEFFYLPRLNMKYNPSENTAIRFSAGRAFRVANVFIENANFLASSREINVAENLLPEVAWNYGMNILYCFKFLGREGTINADAYRTEFEDQIVVDIENQGELSFYNLDGVSYSNSLQFDLGYELFNRFDVKMAYKMNDVKSTFSGLEKTPPLTPENRALLNLSYATNFEKWKFDFTANRIGESRIPSHSLVDKFYSESFYIYNAQVTKKISDFDVYLGVENILSYTQENPILSYNNPNSPSFDASLIYAPIYERMVYFGFRYKLN